MWFNIDPSSGLPIYRQLVEQVNQGVAGGLLKPGDRLPSVRDLALELTINPHTVAKAYQELEREGVVEMPRGKGVFIAAGRAVAVPAREERERMLADAVDRLAAEAYRLRLDPADVLELVRRRFAMMNRPNREENPDDQRD